MSTKGRYRSKKTGKWESYDSSYELRRFKALDRSRTVKKWTKKHGVRIRYKVGGWRRTYIPDILIELVDGSKILEEIKGFVWDNLTFAHKNVRASVYCVLKKWKYRIIRENGLDDVLYEAEEKER